MKLWEVLKALDENHQKKFMHESGDQEVFFNGGVVIKEGDARKLVYLHDWQEVRQPVTWQEAIEAWAKGGKVKCILHGKSFTYDRSKWGNMYSGDGYLCDSEILNGTWYIED